MKTRLSTILTLFWRVFVIAWIALYVLGTLYAGDNWFEPSEFPGSIGRGLSFYLIVGMFTCLFNYLMAGSLKKIYVAGNTLLVSNFLKTIEIPLSQVRFVNGPDLTSLRRITLVLRDPSEFGEEIVFAPKMMQACETAKMLKTLAGISTEEGGE
jgi:hypothetical protein